MTLAYWEVVGGEDKGGIIVRSGKALASKKLPALLNVGSVVEELELAGNRLRFRLFAGTGPKEGWVSVVFKTKYILLEKRSKEQAEAKIKARQVAAAPESVKDKVQPQCVAAAPESVEAEVRPWRVPSVPGDPGGAAEVQGGPGEEGEKEDREQKATVETSESVQGDDAQGLEAPARTAQTAPDDAAPPKSQVREEKAPKTPDDWREEVAEQRKSGDKRVLARTLLDAASNLLKHGLLEEAAQLARDAVEMWERIGTRVPWGIAWDIVAKARLQLLQDQMQKGGTTPQQAQQSCWETLTAANQAVTLLRQIEDPREEADLASARFTLAEARSLAESADILNTAPHGTAKEEAAPAEHWNSQDAADQCKPEDSQELAQSLLEAARAQLKDGMTENAAQLAREAVHQYRLLGSRWQQGIAWDIIARTQLELLKALDESRAHDSKLRQGIRQEALAAACKAVALLCTVGHPSEEKDLEGAQKTFDEVSKHFFKGDEVVLAQTLQSCADSLLQDGKVKGALELASSAVEHYRQIGMPQQLSAALDTAAAIHLRLLVQEGASEASLASEKRKKECYGQALTAACEAVKVLDDALAKEPNLLVPLADARCILLRVRAQEPSIRLMRIQELEDGFGKEMAKIFPSGDQQAVACALERTALAFLKEQASEKALSLATSAAEHYQNLGMSTRHGIVLDIIANAHLELNAQVAGGGHAARHKQAAVRAAKEAVAVLNAAGAEDAERSESLKAARRTLERAGKAVAGTGLMKQQRSGPTAAEAAFLPLQRTFGYVEGLATPRFAKFDVREQVCVSLGGFSHGQVVGDQDGNQYVVVGVKFSNGGDQLPCVWFQPKSLSMPATCSFGGLEVPVLKSLLSVCECQAEPLQELRPEDFDAAEDSDHDIVDLCHDCLLPLGRSRYTAAGSEGCLHGECMAQALLDSAQTEDKARKDKEARQKALDREEYNIGWRPSRMIRCNRDFLQEHGIPCPRRVAMGALCCLALEGTSPPTVRLMETTESKAAVNLGYLMLALQARLRAGIAPFFSLDTPRADEAWQVKTFGPPWLKGTCMGEVLFQADYHLKELSMGEAEQPIVGMPSIWDFPWLQEEWRGREWFVVRNATVCLSDSNILIPQVDIGVEARQQVANKYCELVDVPVTSKDHPLVKYAEVFTHNFDLIAERKSVFYQLREVTRASILAKFLVDNKVAFDDSWLKASDKAGFCKMELPFSRLERHFYEILVRDGVIKEQHGGVLANCIGVYGGVDLNIDAFDLSMPDLISKPIEKHDAPSDATIEGPQDLSKLSQRELRRLIQEAGGQPPLGPAEKGDLIEMLSALRPQEAGAAPLPRQRDKPDAATPLEDGEEAVLEEELRSLKLSQETLRDVILAARRARGKVSSGLLQSTEALVGRFWESLNNGSEQAALLSQVFNKSLSDRHTDGDMFVPPVSDAPYLDRLRALVEEERGVREQRRSHFLSREFVFSAPGKLFPSSWKLVFSKCFARGQSVAAGGNAAWGRRLVESKADAGPIVEASKPVFDRVTEDGTRFRIYRRRPLEVRTIQQGGSPEEVGAVFELRASTPPAEQHPVIKATQYVKSAETGRRAAAADADKEERRGDGAPAAGSLFSYFVVFETDLGDEIFTERLGDGTLVWSENPMDLEDQYARARVICAVDCGGTGLTVGHVRVHYQEALRSPPMSSRRYAEYSIHRTGGAMLDAGSARHPLVVPQMLDKR